MSSYFINAQGKPIDWELIADNFQITKDFQCSDKIPGLSVFDIQHLEEINPNMFAEIEDSFKKLEDEYDKDPDCQHRFSPIGQNKFERFLDYFNRLGRANLEEGVFQGILSAMAGKAEVPFITMKREYSKPIFYFENRLSPSGGEILKKGFMEFFGENGIYVPAPYFSRVVNSSEDRWFNFGYALIFNYGICENLRQV